MGRRVYEELRSAIEERGGTMKYERSGSLHGSWIIELGGKSGRFPYNGHRFPGLDEVYVPKVQNPVHWSDYSHELAEGGVDNLISRLR